jgi:hypothetical protein
VTQDDPIRPIPRRKGYRRHVADEQQLTRILAAIHDLPDNVLSPEDRNAAVYDLVDLYRDVLGNHYSVDAMKAMSLVAALVDVGLSRRRACGIVEQGPRIELTANAIEQACKRDRGGYYSERLAACAANTHSMAKGRIVAATLMHHYCRESEFIDIFKQTWSEFEADTGNALG